MPEQSSSETIPGVAITFDPGPEKWTIDSGVKVSSQLSSTVVSSTNQSTLDNFGSLYAENGAVNFDHGSSSAFIINEKGGYMSGVTFGIRFDGNGMTIENFGINILGDVAGIFFDHYAKNTQVFNYSVISGGVGIFFESSVDGGVLHNNGAILAGLTYTTGIGVEIDTNPGLLTQVTNAKGATISAGAEAIYVALGDLDLVNDGILNGGVDIGNAGSTDTIINRGRIYGSVILNGAADRFNGKGGISGDIYLGGGNDVVIGGRGKLTVHVGFGKSTITAGPGHDRFDFSDFSGGPADLIKHFHPQIDKIVLSETDFPGLGPLGQLRFSHFGINGNAHNAHPQIVYNETNGFLYYDANGDLPGGRTHFATLAGHPLIGHGDFIIAA
jgi:hypothetical protein